MDKIYERINWVNGSEAETTPLSATNMNKMDKGIDDLDDRTIALDRDKASYVGDLKDVTLTGVRSGNVLKYDGTKWVNGTVPGGGGGGTSDYTDLDNKPSINGVMLVGNKTTEDLLIEAGGGATPITQAEWEALTPSSENEGKQYTIIDDYESTICSTIAECEASTSVDDVAGASALKELANKGEVYSTDEVVVGTWIDNKPIYRKVFLIPISANHTSNTTVEITTNANEIVNYYGCYENHATSPYEHMMLNVYDSTSYYLIVKVFSNKIVYKNNGWNNGQFKVIIEYTKA